jgi:hypothetical protein
VELFFAAEFRTSPTPFIVLMGIGFLIGIGGHLYGSRFIVAIGITLIFLATLLLPLTLNVLN